MASQHPAEDVRKIAPKLEHCGIALIKFAEALSGSTEWKRDTYKRWTIKLKGQSRSFVSFQVQSSVWRAYELYKRGTGRHRRRPMIQEA